MIKFKTQQQLQEGDVIHQVSVKKEIGTFRRTSGPIKVHIMAMNGRVYSGGKDKNGKWKDKVGKQDNRFMVFGADQYAVGTKDQLDDCFDSL